MKYDGFGLSKEGSFLTLIQLIQIKTSNNIFWVGVWGDERRFIINKNINI